MLFRAARLWIVLAAAALGLALLIGCGQGASSDLGGPGAGGEVEIVDLVPEQRGDHGPRQLACTGVNQSTGFRQLSVGRSHDGLPLTTVIRECRPATGVSGIQKVNSLSYIYGTCDPGGRIFPPSEGGCAPPLQIEVSPACVRNPSLYPGRLDPTRLPRMRGVPILSRDGGRHLELVTGDETVVIFARSREEARAAARALFAMPAGSTPADLPPPAIEATAKLRAPVAGAFDGTLTCE